MPTFFYKNKKSTLHPSLALKNNQAVYNSFPSSLSNETSFAHLEKLYQAYVCAPQADGITMDFAKLPDSALIYLFAEIRLIEAERGCFNFENREPGCLKAFFKGLSFALENYQQAELSLDKIKKIHAIVTNPSEVEMAQIDDNSSGAFRFGTARLILDPYSYSSKGIREILTLISNQADKNFFLSAEQYFKEINELNNAAIHYGLVHLILETFSEIDTTSDQSCLRSIRAIFSTYQLARISGNPEIPSESLLKVFENIRLIDLIKDFASEVTNSKTADSHIRPVHSLEGAKTLKAYMTLLENYWGYNVFKNLLCKVVESEQTLISKVDEKFKTHAYKCSNFENDNLQSLFIKLKQEAQGQGLMMNFVKSNQVEMLITATINKYNTSVKSVCTQSPDKRLRLIAETLRDFVLIHPFVDANNRVFINILGNMMLLQLGFPPAIYYNPFVFYCHGIDEIVETLKLSCANYLALQERVQGIDNGFEFFDNYNEAERAKLAEIVKPLRDLSATLDKKAERKLR